MSMLQSPLAVKMMSFLQSTEPWRETSVDKEQDLNFLSSFKPHNKDCQHVRILLFGPAGAGKSSFINSADSALRGRIVHRAQEDAVSGKGFTKKYKTFKFQKEGPEYLYPFVLCDIMGIEMGEDAGISVEDITLAMKGHVRDGYEFNPATPLSSESECFNEAPSLSDKVHTLVCVLPADNRPAISAGVLRQLREVRLAAENLGIPQMVLLTKIDAADSNVKENIEDVYKSAYLKKTVENVNRSLGFSEKSIFLVKNYRSEISVNAGADALILNALRQMVSSGEDFINDV